MDKRLIIALCVLALGLVWTIMGLANLPESGDIFTDNTIGLGIITMIISAFIFRKILKLRSDKAKTAD